MRCLKPQQGCLNGLLSPPTLSRSVLSAQPQHRREIHTCASAVDKQNEPLGATAPRVRRPPPARSVRVHATPSADPPGYPLEYPGLAWAGAATFAYSFAAVVVFNDAALPAVLRDLIFAVFRDHQTVANLGLGAVLIHVGYLVFAVGLSRKREAPRRFAVVGGGLAGVSVAWNLMAMTGGSTSIDLFDPVGLAGGGSGNAALLHPYTPRGKVLWQGKEALVAAMKLIAAAELAAGVNTYKVTPFVWRQSILRPAKRAKQAQDFGEFGGAAVNRAASTMAVSALSAQEARQKVPGLGPAALLQDTKNAALLIQGGLVLDSHRYLRALWTACVDAAMDAGGGAKVQLIKHKVTSLQALEEEFGPYSAVIVAAGAANALIEEVGDRLSCELSQGYTLQMVPPRAPQTDSEFPPGSQPQPSPSGRSSSRPSPNPIRIGSANISSAPVETPPATPRGIGDTPLASVPVDLPTAVTGSPAVASVLASCDPTLDGTWDELHATSRESSELQAELEMPRWPSWEEDDGEDPQQRIHIPDCLAVPQDIAEELTNQDFPHPKASPERSRLGGTSLPPSVSGIGNQVPGKLVRSLDRRRWDLKLEGGEMQVVGALPSLVSCLVPITTTSIKESHQKQIRIAVGLQMDPSGGHPISRVNSRIDLAEGDSDSDDPEEGYLEGYPRGAPSLLGSKYLAVQGSRIVLGATKRTGLSAEQAFDECGRKISEQWEVEHAIGELMPEAEKLWPSIRHWRVRRVRSGVRALPPRTAEGAIPLAGKLDDSRRWWVVGGLGARGLVYHAWLGELAAQAVLSNSEGGLPPQLLRWKSTDASQEGEPSP